MDTIQLQCGHCKKVMGISKAHLGQQVQCPHCGLVVQTPPPAEETVALPPAPSREPDPPSNPFADAPTSATPPTEQQSSPSDVTIPSAFTDSPTDARAQAEFAQFKPKPRKDRGVFLVIALIFLVPYAITMTFFVFFMWAYSGGNNDPLQYLRDPAPLPKDGGPKRVQIKVPSPTAKLAESRKAPLGNAIHAGDLQVTPLRVMLTNEGDLKLILRVRNVSTTCAFEPMHNSYVNVRRFDIRYTHLDIRSKPEMEKIFGGNLAFFKAKDATGDQESTPVLAPNEEITIVLETDQSYRDKFVSVIAKSTGDEFTWRVQVRRGFVRVDNKDVSATTVIGVDFTSKDIEREGKS
jgi:hypothetical protein